MASKQIIKTFLNKQICFHLVRVAKLQKVPVLGPLQNKDLVLQDLYNINVSYSKHYLATRYNMQCDGSFLPHKEMETIIQDCDIPYDNKDEWLQDAKFLKEWAIDVIDGP